MYIKLAMRNVVKSYRDYLIYFLTLVFSVCLFYTFNSFQAQKEIMEMSEAQNTIMQMVALFMFVLSIFVMLVLAFLIMYANNFLIRRRKKEFGLYKLMGMEDIQISKILVYETLCIGFVSLVSGLLLGIGASQVLAIITAGAMDVDVSFKIVFSKGAVFLTVCSYSIVFLLLMVLNARMMRKHSLHELLSANKQREKQRLQSTFLSILIFIISLIMLGLCYYLATKSLISFSQFFLFILLFGAIGTLLFFFSLSSFLLYFIRSSKRIYLRNLNMFILRQIHARVNTNFLSMAAVSLLLLLSIGALSIGWNMNLGVSESYTMNTPYDMSIKMGSDADKLLQNITFPDTITKQETVKFYKADIMNKDMYPYLDHEHSMVNVFNTKQPVEILPYSSYIEICKSTNREIKPLKKGEYMIISSTPDMVNMLNRLYEHNNDLKIYGTTMSMRTEAFMFIPYTTLSDNTLFCIILPDESIPKGAAVATTYVNLNMSEGTDLKEVQNIVDRQCRQSGYSDWSSSTRLEIYDNLISMGILFTYIGLYLGIVFIMASAAVLALQQLSEAEDNRQRYEVLRKIGVEKRMINKSIYIQIGIYFLLPLSLAIVHSYFGIQAVASSFSLVFRLTDLLSASFMSAGIILVIYGFYFLITVQGYKRILTQKR